MSSLVDNLTVAVRRGRIPRLCIVVAIFAAIGSAAVLAAAVQPRAIDDARAQAAGIRKLSGKRLILYTDLPSSTTVDELPEVFDQAFPQWCAYFGVDGAKSPDWQMTGFLMKDKARFEASGLAPGDLPVFLNGFAREREFWLYNQTSDYYRRHLMLHEGTHGFMFSLLDGGGPPWYCEGMAEMLATHRWADGRLTLNYFPVKPTETAKLGRIEIIETDLSHHKGHTFSEVLNFDNRAHLKVEPYAWSWAAVAFLDGHPRYRNRFRQLWHRAADDNFNKRLAEKFSGDGPELAEEWQVFVNDLVYNYDFSRTAIDFTTGKPLPRSGAKVSVATDRGWQNTYLQLEKGKTYRLHASGRYQVAKTSKVWWSEPGGVSIRYFHGQPLGVLMAALHPDDGVKGESPLVAPLIVGLGTMIRPEKTGTLYLRTNVSAGEFASAAGKATVEVTH